MSYGACRLGDAPGDDQGTYAAWASAVKRAGGAAVVLPYTSTPAARYPSNVWIPKADAGTWSEPDAYSNDGQYGYYRAPASVVTFVAGGGLTAPTSTEVDTGTNILTPDWLKSLEATLVTAAKIGAIGVGIWVAWPIVRNALARRRARS